MDKCGYERINVDRIGSMGKCFGYIFKANDNI